MSDIFLLIEGQQQGPYSKDQIRQSLAEGRIPGELPAWDGIRPDWIPVSILVENIALPDVEDGKQALPLAEKNEGAEESAIVVHPESTASKTTNSKESTHGTIYQFLTIALAIVVGVILLGLSVGVGIGVTRSKLALPAITVVNAAPPSVSTSLKSPPAVAASPEVKADSVSDEAVKMDEAKQEIKEMIENHAGYTQDHPSENYHFTRGYTNVFFDGSVLLYEDFDDFSDLGSHTKTSKDKFDLSDFKADSFIIAPHDYTKEDTQSGTPRSPEILYDIACISTKYPDDSNSLLGIDFADKNIAQEVAKDLNFLSEHIKPTAMVADAPSPDSSSITSPTSSDTIFGNVSDDRLFRYWKVLAKQNHVELNMSDEEIKGLIRQEKAQAELLKASMSPAEYQKAEAKGEAQIDAVLGKADVP